MIGYKLDRETGGLMKLGIMQPYFLPYIGYWQLIHAVDTFVIYDDVNYIKGGWINRNFVLGHQRIYIPINHVSQNKLINELKRVDDCHHYEKLIKTLERLYKKAPYYEQVMPVLISILLFDELNLSKYLMHLIQTICDYLGIDTKLIESSSLSKNNDLRGQEKILEICSIFNADGYYNVIGGQKLYKKSTFSEHGIDLRFIKSDEIAYRQFHDFEPSLSIIDIMMFNTPAEIKKYLNQYKLIF